MLVIESPSSYTKHFADDAIDCSYIVQWINMRKNISICLFSVFMKVDQVMHKQMFIFYDTTFWEVLLL